MKNMQRVIIVGGGFAGLELVKGLANSKKYEVILVEVNNYNFFPPLIEFGAVRSNMDCHNCNLCTLPLRRDREL